MFIMLNIIDIKLSIMIVFKIFSVEFFSVFIYNIDEEIEGYLLPPIQSSIFMISSVIAISKFIIVVAKVIFKNLSFLLLDFLKQTFLYEKLKYKKRM